MELEEDQLWKSLGEYTEDENYDEEKWHENDNFDVELQDDDDEFDYEEEEEEEDEDDDDFLPPPGYYKNKFRGSVKKSEQMPAKSNDPKPKLVDKLSKISIEPKPQLPAQTNPIVPANPFKITVSRINESVSVDNKELTVIPSIKIAAFEAFVKKMFQNISPTSFLTLDPDGKERITEISQLKPSQVVYLHELKSKPTTVKREDSVKESKKEIADEEEEDDDDQHHILDDANDDDFEEEEVNFEEEEFFELDIDKIKESSKPKKKYHVDDNTELRTPICCVLGHVDTGKTSLLDKIRSSHIQEGEAGGITQQIGATFFPIETIKKQTTDLNEKYKFQFKIPGLLIIDTPGHESFSNLRVRGSSLCDIAILVVDIMHGLEAQTIESINLMKKRRIPFIIAMNKVDRLNGWVSTPNSPINESLKNQSEDTKELFEKRISEISAEIQTEGLNAMLYYRNKDFKRYVSIVPTSAVTGEGIQDLELLIVLLSQNIFRKRLYKLPKDELRCTIMETKVIESLGTTIDVILLNGELKKGDTIVVCGLNGPIVTVIKHIITPSPLEEIRTKGDLIGRVESIQGVQGVRIFAKDLEKAVGGSSLWVVNYCGNKKESVDVLKKRVTEDLRKLSKKFGKSPAGVYVMASTLGSLEALLEFLQANDVPVSGINVGPVNKRDVLKAGYTYRCILAFDVPVTKIAASTARQERVTIFTAKIIYHLLDEFKVYMRGFTYNENVKRFVEPCVLYILPGSVIKSNNPIVFGVSIQGRLRIDTTLCLPFRNFDIGKVTAITSIPNPNGEDTNFISRPVNEQSGGFAIIKVEPEISSQGRTVIFGRDVTYDDILYSKITKLDDLSPDVRNLRHASDFVINYCSAFGIKPRKYHR